MVQLFIVKGMILIIKEKKYIYEMKSLPLNIISIIIFIILVVITYLLYIILNYKFNINSLDYQITFILLMPYFIFHEILHSIGYVINGANFKNITYGMHLEKGILCCSCKQSIKKRTILWSLIYPLLFIGIITYIIGIILNNKILIFLSIANITGCSGDIIMFYHFLKIKKLQFFEYDNPMAFGIITEDNLDNKKLFGLKQIENEKTVQTIDKKVTISKKSIIYLIFYFILCLLNFISY